MFQKYYMEFVNKLLKMGVRGFRYDTAKHIGVHSDPLDTEAGVTENDFWDVATGRKEVLGVSLALPYDSLFVYGEVLQDRTVPEEEYADYFGQTASTYGHIIREVLWKRSAKDIDVLSWYHRAAPEYLTTWVTQTRVQGLQTLRSAQDGCFSQLARTVHHFSSAAL